MDTNLLNSKPSQWAEVIRGKSRLSRADQQAARPWLVRRGWREDVSSSRWEKSGKLLTMRESLLAELAACHLTKPEKRAKNSNRGAHKRKTDSQPE